VLVRYSSSTIAALTGYSIIVKKGRTPPQLVRYQSMVYSATHHIYLVGWKEGVSEVRGAHILTR